jgi:tetratricopeptide (TPR) repeat protein
MQNQITATMCALLAACLFVQTPRVDARAIVKGVESGIPQQEPAAASQDRQEAATAPAENDAAAEKEYAAGRAAMRMRDWKAAIKAFKRTVELNPDYRDASKRLAEARTILHNEEIEAVAARYYDEGVAAMNRNDVDAALDAFEKVSRINRRYRDLEELYARLEGRLPRPQARDSAATPNPFVIFTAPPAETPKKFVAAKVDSPAANADSSTHAETAVAGSANLDSLYQQALAALARDDWKSAVIAFERITFVQPNYRNLDDLVAVARANLLRQAQSQSAQLPAETGDGKILTPVIATMIAAIIGLALLGLFIVSPTGRGRLYRWQGDYIAAALLYERMIAQKPDRAKLYSALAEIYLRLKRDDSAAMRVFEKVLALNLPTRHRAELHAIVTQQDRHESREPQRASEMISAANKNGALLASGRARTLGRTEEAHKKLPTPRKPRKKKELVAALDHVNGVAADLSGANGVLKTDE